MRKIRLDVGDLIVEGFSTSRAGGGARGTVAGMVTASECATLGWDPTCAFFASCDVRAECDATVVESTCPNVGGC
jgi:hypothetical protein